MFYFCSRGCQAPEVGEASVESLGQAWRAGWRITAHCLWYGQPKRRSDRRIPWCDTVTELDLKTLVWTRGERFPLSELASRLKCPKCGFRNVRVLFNVPGEPGRGAGRAAE
jgi:hypothetical protein